jgi:hypothetical protein
MQMPDQLTPQLPTGLALGSQAGTQINSPSGWGIILRVLIRYRVLLWLLLAAVILVAAAILMHHMRENARWSYESAMYERMSPVIDAIEECRGWDDGTRTLPTDFSILRSKSKLATMPMNIYTGQPMRCVALTDAPSPGDFSYFRANLKYSLFYGTELRPCITPSGYYLIVYGSKRESTPNWRRKAPFIGDYAVKECKRLHVSYIYYDFIIQEDICTKIQPLSEIMLREQGAGAKEK